MNNQPKTDNRSGARSPRSLTRKGRQTRADLLAAARAVFKDTGYYQASVSEISRRSGLSQGAFYQYFKNKEQVLLELNDDILGRFWGQAELLSLGDLAPRESLRQVLGLLFEHAREHSYFHRILGEFELIDLVTIGYYDSMALYLRRYIRRQVTEGHFRPLDANILAFGLMGMAVFQAMDWSPEGRRYPVDETADWAAALVLKGLCGSNTWSGPDDPTVSSYRGLREAAPPGDQELTQGQMTARAILEAAESVFGQYGFHRASIAEITRQAGVAQGTFYVHFKSKRDLLENFVRHLSREMRRTSKQVTGHLEDRREVEREAILTFFQFLSDHRRIYRLVAESETMGREISMWYYKKLAAGYEPGLARGVKAGQIRDDLPVDFMVRSAMGALHMIGLKWLVWNASPVAEVPKQLAGDTISFLLKGLSPAFD